MEFTTIKKNYSELNNVARSPTLQTVLMVEKFIDENSGEYKKTDLFNNLPKKVMWQTFQVIMEYLENIGKIAYDNKGHVVYIWNPELVKKYRNKKELEWNAK
ncbi:hypothetical protein K0A97_00870 [Patescibacteria group bacterium]|nr:hypothetical protein [Patescibacteria group bacterium]